MHAEVDRARQKAKEGRAQLSAQACERDVHEAAPQAQPDLGTSAQTAAQRELEAVAARATASGARPGEPDKTLAAEPIQLSPSRRVDRPPNRPGGMTPRPQLLAGCVHIRRGTLQYPGAKEGEGIQWHAVLRGRLPDAGAFLWGREREHAWRTPSNSATSTTRT